MRERLSYVLVVALLSLSIVLVMPVEPTIGQVYTTSTSQTTVVIPITYTTAQTTIALSSYTTTSEIQKAVLTTFSQGASDWHQCTPQWFSFYAEAGQVVTGTVDDGSLRLVTFILSDHQFNLWRKANCDPTATGSVEWQADEQTSIPAHTDVHWDPPETGTYWFVVEAIGPISNAPLTVKLLMAQSQRTTVTLYSTLSSARMYYATQTSTALLVSPVPISLPDLPLVIFLILASIFVLVPAYAIISTRRRNKPY